MLFDPRQRWLIAERCWFIYDVITSAFEVPETFHTEHPLLAEVAVVSGFLGLRTPIGSQGYLLDIHEEYGFQHYDLVIRSYSYNLLDSGQRSIIRADPLPHHRVDYKNRPLSAFPHHLHDRKGRITSFTGQIMDFIKHAQRIR